MVEQVVRQQVKTVGTILSDSRSKGVAGRDTLENTGTTDRFLEDEDEERRNGCSVGRR